MLEVDFVLVVDVVDLVEDLEEDISNETEKGKEGAGTQERGAECVGSVGRLSIFPARTV